MTRPIYVNGRFASQPLTGVQRFAREITAALDRRWEAGRSAAPILLMPRDTPEPSPYRSITVRTVGHARGHVWEQCELPLHARGGFLVNLANVAPLLAGRQLVVLHDAGIFAHPEAYSRLYRRAHKTLEWALALRQTRFATVSRFSRDEIAKHLRISGDDIAVIPEGADHILRIAPDPEVLHRHGLDRRRYVLAVGSLVAHKNLSALRDLAQRLVGSGFDLAIVGGVATRVFGADGAQDLPQPAKYLGRVSDAALRALYESAACFVFPSRYEGFGIPPIEALACGCPMVAASASAVMEVCGEAARYADPDRPSQIADEVMAILTNQDLANALRQRGQERVKMFTWDNAAASLMRVIERFQ